MTRFMRDWKRILLTVAFCSITFVSVERPQAGTGIMDLTVCVQGCQFPTIQAAVDAALPGTTIDVRAGHYRENVLITKDLILRGAGVKETFLLTASEDRPLITIQEANVQIQGFTLMALPGTQPDLMTGAIARAVHIVGLSQARLETNHILGPRNGRSIDAEGPVQLQLQNNQVQDASWGIYISGSERIRPDALDIVRGWAQAQILNNDISGHEFDGVSISAAQVYLRGNRIFRNMIGVNASGPTRLDQNQIFENAAVGIQVANYVQTFQNEVYGNFDGILLRFKRSVLIAGFDRVVNNRHWSIALHNKACGYDSDLISENVFVRGDVRDTPFSGPGSLCPPYPGPPWPEKFVVKL